jgi:hypothetical protein
LACRRSAAAVRSFEIGDMLKVMTELNNDEGGVRGARASRADLASPAPERQLL